MTLTLRLPPRHLSLWGLALLLGISVAANAFLYHVAMHYYRVQNLIRLDPMGLEVYADAPLPPMRGAQRVLLFGDSRVLAWRTFPKTTHPVDYLARGIGGQTSAQALGRFDADVASSSPHVIVIQLGSNELKTVALFPRDRARIIRRSIRNITDLVERSRATGAHVILTTLFPLGEVSLQRRFVWSEQIRFATSEVNRALVALEAPGVTIFDTAKVLGDHRGWLNSAYEDGPMHINSAGYEALNQTLGPVLERLHEERRGGTALGQRGEGLGG